MKLSTTTLDILKNFAAINANLVVNGGNAPIASINEAKSIMAEAQLEETFPRSFGIYDLNAFINVYNLMANPDCEFGETAVELTSGNTRATYRYADVSILTTPKSKIKMPPTDLSLTITSEQLGAIKKAAGVFGHSVMSIQGKLGVSDKVSLVVCDPKFSGGDTYSIDIPAEKDESNSFNFHILMANLKLLPGDYNIALSKQMLSHWGHTSYPVEYYVSLEKTSTYM